MDLRFDELAATLLRDSATLVRQWLPGGRLEGDEWCCGSIKGDKGRSFKVNIKKGTWADFAGSEKGGDLISLYKELHKLPTMAEAYRILANEPIKPSKSYKPVEKAADKLTDEIEIIPDDLSIPQLNIPNFKYSKSWTYRNAEGQKIYIVQRYDGENGKKEIRPFRMVEGKLVSKQLPKPRPIYNLDRIAKHKNKPIMIVEGEKAAQAASVFEAYNVTTWPMGSQNVAYADWSVLKGHPSITIIPDADAPGREAAIWLGEHLIKVQKVTRVSVVDPVGKPEGWDIADHIDSGEPVRDLADFIKANMLSYEQFVERHAPAKLGYDEMPQQKDSFPSADDADPIGLDSTLDEGFGPAVNYENELLTNPFFRFLGFKGEMFFFYIYKTGQILELGSKQCGEESYLIMLAPPDFWLETFQGNMKAARVALVHVSQEIRFNSRKVRKVGMWMDGDKPVAHLGEFLMTDKGVTPLRQYKSKDHVYEYSDHRVQFSRLAPEADVPTARLLIEMCSGGNWTDASHGPILAGWMFMSLCCASLRWRSHIYLIGPAGSGKTWMLDNIVDKFFMGFKFKAASSSTEAAIRQSLDNNIVPVIMDEAEAEDQNASVRRKAIFELARFASAATPDTPITKGSSNQAISAREFFVRSPFLFASINTSMDYADESRTTFLKLKPIPNDIVTRAMFKQHEMLVRRTMKEDYTCGMMRRAVRLLPKIIDTYETMVDVILIEMAKDARQAEQMSYFLTGLWYLENDREPNIEEAANYVRRFKTISEQRSTMLSSEEKLVSLISQIKVEAEIRGRTVKRSVGELAMLSQRDGKGADPDMEYHNAHMALKRAGMMLDNSRQPYRFYILNESTVVRQGLYGSAFYPSWDKVLSRVKNAKEHNDTVYLGLQGPSVSIPLKAFIGEINALDDNKSVDEPF